MGCRHRFSVTAGAPMHRPHLPLRTWAHGIHLSVASSKGISAMKLREMAGIASPGGNEGVSAPPPPDPSGP